MFKLNRCSFGLHYWLYNPERRLRVCDACELKQVKTKGLIFNRWDVLRRRSSAVPSAPIVVQSV